MKRQKLTLAIAVMAYLIVAALLLCCRTPARSVEAPRRQLAFDTVEMPIDTIWVGEKSGGDDR